MNSRLLRNTGLATFGVLVQGLARFVYTIAIGRAFGADTLGQISGLLALSVFVSLFWPTASGVAASRYISHDAELGQSPSNSVRVLRRDLLLSLPVLAIGTWVAAILMTGDLSLALSTAFLTIGYSAYVYTRGAALGDNRFLRVAVTDTLSSFASLGLLLLVLLGQAHWALLVPLGVGYALFAIACWPRVGAEAPESPGKITRFVAVNSVAQIATGGALQIAMIAAHLFDTPFNAGLFAAAFSLATPAAMVGQSLNQVLVPHFSRQVATDPSGLGRSTLRITLVAGAGLGVAFLTVGVASDLLMTLLYGPEFAGAASYMRWLLLCVYIYSVSLVPAASLVVSGRNTSYTIYAGAGFLLGALLTFVLGPVLGAWAAIIGYGVGSLLSAILIVAAGIKSTSRESPAAEHTTAP